VLAEISLDTLMPPKLAADMLIAALGDLRNEIFLPPDFFSEQDA